MQNSVLVVDPGLRTVSGHHYSAAQAIQESSARLGMRALILGHRERDKAMNDVRPVFSENLYYRTDASRRSFESAIRLTLTELRAAAGYGKGIRLIVLPTCDQVLAATVARWLDEFPSDSRPGVLGWTLFAPSGPDGRTRVEWSDPEVRSAFRELARIASPKMMLFCETAGMAAHYRDATGVPFGVEPGPSVTIQRRTLDRNRPDGKMVFGTLGHFVSGKGYGLVPAAFVVSGVSDRAELLIHAAEARETPAGLRFVNIAESLVAGLEVMTDPLIPEKFRDLLESLDVLLLPYDPAIYDLRGSNLLAESQAFGIPAIVSGVKASEHMPGTIKLVGQSYEELGAAIAAIVSGHRTGGLPRDTGDQSLDAWIRDLTGGRHRRQGTGRPVRQIAARLEVAARKLGPRRRIRLTRQMLRARLDSGGLEKGFVPDVIEDERWDVAVPALPEVRYVIASMRRSGSNLLVRQLLRAGIGVPAEYFNERVAGPLASRWNCPIGSTIYLDRLMTYRQSESGVFGCKVHLDDVMSLGSHVRTRLLQGAKIVLTRRRDLAAQAASLLLARTTDSWDPWWPSGVEPANPIDPDDVNRLYGVAEELVAEEMAWLQLFDELNLTHVELTYEDFISRQSEAVTRIANVVQQSVVDPRPEAPPPMDSSARDQLAAALRKRLGGLESTRAVFGACDLLPDEG